MLPGIARLILICCLPALCACSTKPVDILDKQRFELMASHNFDLFNRQDIIDSRGKYRTGLLGLISLIIPRGDVDERLYANLSPFFLYMDLERVRIPDVFQDAYPRYSVTMQGDGFLVRQKDVALDVQLVAVVDWDGDNIKSWLVSCRESRTIGNIVREYYLVVSNPDDEAWDTRLLSMYYPNTGLNVRYADYSGKHDAVVDVQRGQKEVIMPPSTNPGETSVEARPLNR